MDSIGLFILRSLTLPLLIKWTSRLAFFYMIVGDCHCLSPSTFLLGSLGGKGVLADQEDALFQLRMEKESAAKEDLEKEVRLTQLGKFCATPFGIDVVGITEVVGFIGALVGGTYETHSS